MVVIGASLILCLLIGICYYCTNFDNKIASEIVINDKDIHKRVPNPMYDGTSSTSSLEFTIDNFYHEIRNSVYNPRIAQNQVYDIC